MIGFNNIFLHTVFFGNLECFYIKNLIRIAAMIYQKTKVLGTYLFLNLSKQHYGGKR